MGVSAKKLSEKTEKVRDGNPDRESTNFFYSWGAFSFSGSKHQLILETVQEHFQLGFSRRINALFIPNFIPHIVWTSKYNYSVWQDHWFLEHKLKNLLRFLATLGYFWTAVNVFWLVREEAAPKFMA